MMDLPPMIVPGPLFGAYTSQMTPKQTVHPAEEHVNYVIDAFLGPGKTASLGSGGDMKMPSDSVRSAMIAAARQCDGL